MITPFLDENFLLQTSTAERLYHEYARDLPIIDYHNHLPPDEIANDVQFSTITDVWLKGDHYKWRAMRANGINERFITGEATDFEKFSKWAETVPYTMRNPLYHWTHLELHRYFDISELLEPSSAEKLYTRTNELLQSASYSAQGLLNKLQVEVVCTTDHPTDDLSHHRKYAQSGKAMKMLPTFRPDRFLVVNQAEFPVYLQQLEEVVNDQIETFDDLIHALSRRIDYFAEHGCQLSDHGLSQLYPIKIDRSQLNGILTRAKNKQPLSKDEVAMFQMAAMYELGELYYDKNWTMQLHLGPLRDNNQRLKKKIGADVGCDSIGDFDQAEGLATYLNYLDAKGKLTKTILYNLNPRDNEVFATMAGNFNDGSVPGKIQWGSAWWFLDQKDGMEKQINALSNLGLLSRFIGMLTDSRSFLSFPRHEYFRRILCNIIGNDVHGGQLPNDVEWLGQMVENICYHNAKSYFNF